MENCEDCAENCEPALGNCAARQSAMIPGRGRQRQGKAKARKDKARQGKERQGKARVLLRELQVVTG